MEGPAGDKQGGIRLLLVTMRREDVVRIRELGLRHPLQSDRQDPLRSKGILLACECSRGSKGIGREGEMVVCNTNRVSIHRQPRIHGIPRHDCRFHVECAE